MKFTTDRLRKVLVYYSPIFTNYWDVPTECIISSHITSIGEYYLNVRARYCYPGTFDKTGIPLYKIGSKSTEIYHPTVISLFALAIFSFIKEKEFKAESLIESFITQADWLINNQFMLSHGSGWNLNLDINSYNLRSPWISAMTQGCGISVLSRAYHLTKKEEYLSTCLNAIMPLHYNVSEGGLINYFQNELIFEEYPTSRTNAVLNGHIFALFGIYDLYLISRNESVKELFDKGVAALKNLVKYFDLGYWSRYSLYDYPLKNPANYSYHILHTEQMKALYFITQDTFFLKISQQWKLYSAGFSKRSMAVIKKVIFEMRNRNIPGF